MLLHHAQEENGPAVVTAVVTGYITDKAISKRFIVTHQIVQKSKKNSATFKSSFHVTVLLHISSCPHKKNLTLMHSEVLM